MHALEHMREVKHMSPIRKAAAVLAVSGALVVWNIAYGRRARRRGEARGAEARARGEVAPPMPH